MASIIHMAVGLILVAAHAVFLLRALAMRRRDGQPGPVDRIARNLSHFGLPAALITGIIALTGSGGPLDPALLGVAHIVLGILPVIIIIAFTPLLALKRRIPWLLPGITMMLFLAAGATGLMRYLNAL